MSKLLINERPIQVLPRLAKEIGLNEAIFLQQLHYWLTPHEGTTWKPHYREWKGKVRPWVFNTYEEKELDNGKLTGWASNFPFWSIPTIKRVVRSLKNSGLIIVTDKFNKHRTNRTLWYTIDYDALNVIEEAIDTVEVSF